LIKTELLNTKIQTNIKTHQNTSKHIKTHQNTSKHIKTHQNRKRKEKTNRVSEPVYKTRPKQVPDATTVSAHNIFSTVRASVVVCVWCLSSPLLLAVV
jgi:hypothetical protein